MNLDNSYWQKFYSENKEPFNNSLFSEFCLKNYINKDSVLIELGCGNGRDAIFFSKNNINVTAVDSCSTEIEFLSKKYKSENINFYCHDFCKMPVKSQNFDIIYSRFTLHSINKQAQQELFNWVSKSLKIGGIFCIEARGFKNSLYKKGKKISDDEYIYDDHYRRFLNINELCLEFKNMNFEILYAKEDLGFAPFNGFDDYFIRVIVKRLA